MRALAELHAYWREPSLENVPEAYLAEGHERSEFLVDLLRRHASLDASILEVGCNAGRNLDHLARAGFSDLAGIEINEHAVALLHERHPEIPVHVGPIEDVLPNLGRCDVVFTMAVLEHLHPDSERVFADLARKARKLLVVIEDERTKSWRHAPRDYGVVFETLGLRQVEVIREVPSLDEGYVCRVFVPKMGIAHFRDTHKGETVYVLGSGPSLNYLDPEYFADKTTVAVNTLSECWPIEPSYIVTKYHEEAERMAMASSVPVIVPRFCHGNLNAAEAAIDLPNTHVFEHRGNAGAEFDASAHWPTEPDQLVVSWSTITTAMHFAAYLGAATIVLVGHDCGELNGETHVAGYLPKPEIDEIPWLLVVEQQSLAVKAQLAKRYGVRVWSLSPFLNFDLDGVPFIGKNRINA